MISDKKIEKLENSAVKLTLTIDQSTIKQEYDDLVKKYCKTAQIKGFRKGKVPPNILEQRFGESLKAETSMNIMENSLKEAFETIEEKPLPYMTPELQDEPKLKLDENFIFSVRYDIYPSLNLPEYKGIEIVSPVVNITKKDEERELKAIQEQNALVVNKKDPTVEKDDIITIDYCEVDGNGAEIEKTKSEGFVFIAGSGNNIYKLDDDLLSMKLDEEKIIHKEYAPDNENKDLAGRKVDVKVKIKAIKQKELPKLDDELAQDVSEKYNNLDDLKTDILKKLEENRDAIIQDKNIKSIMDRIIENMTIELPESMIKKELEFSLQNYQQQIGIGAKQFLKILEAQGKTPEDFYEQWRPEVIKKIKGQLILNEVVKLEKLEVGEEELEAELQQQAERTGQTIEQLKEQLKNNNMLDYIRSSLLDKKAYDFLLKSANIKKGEKINYLDIVERKE